MEHSGLDVFVVVAGLCGLGELVLMGSTHNGKERWDLF